MARSGACHDGDGTSRTVNRSAGWYNWTVTEKKEFNTENTEDHREPLRFFTAVPRAPDRTPPLNAAMLPAREVQMWTHSHIGGIRVGLPAKFMRHD